MRMSYLGAVPLNTSEEQQKKLTQAAVDFSLRVLSGKECTAQETATLPQILDFLLPR